MLHRVFAQIQRLISIAILIGWLAPSVAALSVGIHLASEHSDSHALEHQIEIVDLALAASHGHRHDLETALDHSHDVQLNRQAPASRPDLDVLAILPAASSPRAALPQIAALDQALRRGPPRPLFEVHCVLLI